MIETGLSFGGHEICKQNFSLKPERKILHMILEILNTDYKTKIYADPRVLIVPCYFNVFSYLSLRR